jgi:hypothetical protein
MERLVNKNKHILIIFVICFLSNLVFSQNKLQNNCYVTVDKYEINDTSIFPILDTIIMMKDSCFDKSKFEEIYLDLNVITSTCFSIRNYDESNRNLNIKGAFHYRKNIFIITNDTIEFKNELIPVFLNKTKIKYVFKKNILKNSIYQSFSFLIILNKNEWEIDDYISCDCKYKNTCNPKWRTNPFVWFFSKLNIFFSNKLDSPYSWEKPSE